MPTDFRDGKTFPRRGRDAIDGVLWLLRVSDKGRAAAAGTLHDYIYPCPMDLGTLERWGVSVADFDAALARYPSDDGLLAWLRGVTTPARIADANRWLVTERLANLDRQDSEESAG